MKLILQWLLCQVPGIIGSVWDWLPPAKRLCDASSVLVGVELPISSRFQPSPLASKLLAASRKGEHCASISPCQYIAYPQQVLCSAFSRRQVLLGTVRPQHWICKGEFVWPNGEAGGWGKKKSPNGCYGGGSHTKTFPGAYVYTQTHSGRRVLVDEAAGQICLQAGNTNRRQQLLGSEGNLGHQQGAEDAEWPSLARVEGTRQPWLATSLEEGKLQTETRSRQGLHQTCLREGKSKEKPSLRASPHEHCHRRRRTVAHAACATHKTDCSRTYDTMAVQLSLERCGVVLLDRSRGGTAPGSQPQRSPTSATDCDSDPSGLTMDGQSRTNGQQALKIVQWNAEGVRLKKTELQHFLKLKAIDMCCILETHLSSSHRFFIRGYEVSRQDREIPTKGRTADPGKKQHPCHRNPEIR